jgi:hypothetical protein
MFATQARPYICHKPRKAKNLFPLNEAFQDVHIGPLYLLPAISGCFGRRPSAVEPIEDFKDHTLENSSQFAKG